MAEKKEEIDDEYSLNKQFQLCEAVIDDYENGKSSTKDLQDRLKECLKRLENLTREVSARSVFSKNETVSELPTNSLQYMLLPFYLATVTQNIIVEAEMRLDTLDKAKIYLRDFLERLLSYEVISFELPWLITDSEDDDHKTVKRKIDPNQARTNLIKRYEHEKQMREQLSMLKSERSLNTDDDSLNREIILLRIRLYALKAMSELDQIEQERPLLEHMLKLRSGQIQPERKQPRVASRPAVILTRDQVQKKVFGLGYPSIPTVTVDEWCNNMMKQGRLETSKDKPSTAKPEKDESDSESEDEEDEEEKRAKARRWDEYKDTHKRGWGNVHNKG